MPKQKSDSAKVFFIVNKLYEWSQNFITRELTELNKLGLDFVIGARDILERTDLSKDEQKLEAKYFHIPENPFLPKYLFSHFTLALSRPLTYLKAWGHLFGMRHEVGKFPRGLVCLFRAAYIARSVEKMGVNLIHAHFLTAPGETALYLSKLTGIPFGGTAYAMDLFVDTSGLKKKLHEIAYVNGTTNYNERFMASQMSHHPERSMTLYYGIHASEKMPAPIEHEHFRFLAVGRLVPKKGFEYLIEACGILKERGHDFRCEFIGKGPLEEPMQAQIEKLGLNEMVSLAGFVAPNEMPNKYRSGDFLVAPCIIAENGDVDGLPNVILEAMNFGLPAISTSISGIPEAIDEGVNGWLVPPNTVTELADAMEKALLANDLIEMRKAAHRTVFERFDVRKNVLPIKTLLESQTVR